MSYQKRKLADRFFNDQCSPEEAEKVLEWLDTSEGEEYLHKKMDADLSSAGKNLKEIVGLDYPSSSGLNKEKSFRNILRKIALFEPSTFRRKTYLSPLIKMIAVLLVVTISSILFLITDFSGFSEVEKEIEPVVLVTVSDEQRETTLGDGTVIHMNENSRVTIPGDYMEQNRSVLLEGEAYFEVTYNKESPFSISTLSSEIEVLGTSFNVKSSREKGLVEVAVVEGQVSLTKKNGNGAGKVFLQKGNYGYLDILSHQITTEYFGVENYLAWKSGEFVFNGLSLDQVCIQLNRFYEISCRFEDETIKERELTANFSKDDLANTLSVISLTLDVPYSMDGEEVFWVNRY